MLITNINTLFDIKNEEFLYQLIVDKFYITIALFTHVDK